ncbi:MAG TPA: SRPBCC family protein [Ilumatobacteraceae bacterium]|nr:SRPBCC family protein [Ilumatobacteraceae bacterium]
MPAPRHIFQTYVRATPEAVWQAITDPDFTRRYFHRTAIESTFAVGAAVRYVLPDGTDAVCGQIEEVEPGRRLVMTWRVLYDAALAAEPPSRVEWVVTPGPDGVTRVTTIHRDLALSPGTSRSVGTGWPWILDSLKSLLETGAALEGTAPGDDTVDRREDEGDDAEGALHRQQAIDANNATWELLDVAERTPDEVDDLLARAYTAAFHWRRAARRGPENAVRASWLISHVHAVLGQGDLALHHADRALATATAAGLADFDLAYAHEARARALACLDRRVEAAAELAAARAIPIADDEDRTVLLGDLAAEPWYGLATPTPAPSTA